MTTLTASPVVASSQRPKNTRSSMLGALLLLDVVFFATAAVFISLAPCGSWQNIVWGRVLWDNNDPGGPYVISALSFFRDFGRPPFVGHPGMTLQGSIALIAHAVYGACDLFAEPAPFIEFWTQHIRWLFVLSGLFVAAMHILSFHVLYVFARKLLDDAQAAFLAVLAYATLLPTLFYLTRISVEPIFVTLMLLTLLSLWRVHETWMGGERYHAHGWAGLAGLSSAAAILTKLHLSLPLVPFALLQLLLQGRGGQPGLLARMRTRYRLALCYLAAFGGLFIAGSAMMNWSRFFRIWRQYAPDSRHRPVSEAAQDLATIVRETVVTTWNDSLRHLGRYFEPDAFQFVFTVTEGCFLVLAVIGVIWFWHSRRKKRPLAIWPLLYGLLILPIVCYRGSWHYLFLHLAGASVFFSFFLCQAANRLTAGRIGPMLRMAGLVLLILLIHSASILWAIESKYIDVRIYRGTYKPIYDALARLNPGERLALHAKPGVMLWKVHGAYPRWTPTARVFHKAFNSRFVIWTGSRRIDKQWLADNKVVEVINVRRQHRYLVKAKPKGDAEQRAERAPSPRGAVLGASVIPPANGSK